MRHTQCRPLHLWAVMRIQEHAMLTVKLDCRPIAIDVEMAEIIERHEQTVECHVEPVGIGALAE